MDVGGVTTATAYFGISNAVLPTNLPLPVRQKLASVIDHSLFVGPHNPNENAINPEEELYPAYAPSNKVLLPRGYHTKELGS